MNPLDGLNRPHAPRTRDRVLSGDEASQLLQYTLSDPGRFSKITCLLLMTGQRRGEIAGLQWSEIDGDQLSLEPQRTKNKHRHEVPILKMAAELLESIEGGSAYLFGIPEQYVPFNR